MIHKILLFLLGAFAISCSTAPSEVACLNSLDTIKVSVNDFRSIGTSKKDCSIEIDKVKYSAKIKKIFIDTLDFSSKYGIKLNKEGAYHNLGRRFKITPVQHLNIKNVGAEVLAKNLGVICSVGMFKLLNINDSIHEVCYFSEDVEKEALERDFGITNYKLIRFKEHNDSTLDYRFNIELEEDSLSIVVYERLDEFVQLLKDKNFKAAQRLIDVSYWAKFLMLSKVFSSDSILVSSELRLVYDFSIGKFYPVFKPLLKQEKLGSNYLSRFIMTSIVQSEDLRFALNSEFNTLDEDELFSTLDRITSEFGEVYHCLLSSDGVTVHDENWRNKKHEIITKNKVALKDKGSEIEACDDGFEREDFNYRIEGNTIRVLKGSYVIKDDVSIPQCYSLEINAGAKFLLDSGVSFCVNGDFKVNGENGNPVVFKCLNEEHMFGALISISNNRLNKVDINYLEIDGGKGCYFNGVFYSGELAVYGADFNISNSSVTHSGGDDGLNVKRSKVKISNCQFDGNLADQIDVDFCVAEISNCVFSPSKIDANGDGVDFSGSYGIIDNCSFVGFLDKGMSIGERSKVLAINNTLTANKNGIVVKDQSVVYSNDNEFQGNDSNYKLYIKKKIFELPKVYSSQPSDSLVLKDTSSLKNRNAEFMHGGESCELESSLLGIRTLKNLINQ